MADSKFFGIPFGTSGDKATIPEAAQPGGAVSYTQGFGPDYERDPATDPLAKRVPRDETNEFYFQVSNALKFLQLYGLPEWYAVDGEGNPVSYPITARVRHAGGAWVSLIPSNLIEPGTDATKWAPDDAFSFSALEASVAEMTAGLSGVKVTTPRRVASAVQRAPWTYATAGGTVNAITATLAPAPVDFAALSATVLAIRTTTANTGAVTLNVNGTGAQPLRYADGTDLQPGETLDRVLQVRWNGTFYELLNDKLLIGRSLATSNALGRNLLINPEFNFFRRINSTTGTGSLNLTGVSWLANSYYLDRWRVGVSAATITIAGENLTLTSGSLTQVVEDAKVGGQAVVFSAEVLSGSLQVTIAGITKVLPAPVVGTRSMEVFDIPIGSNGDISVTLQGSAGAVSFARPQLEIGRVSAPYRPRGPVWESMLCDRYCQRHQFRSVWTAQAANYFASLNVFYRQVMRIVPTLNWNLTENTNVTGYVAPYVTIQGAQFGWQSSAAGPMIVAGHVLLEADYV